MDGKDTNHNVSHGAGTLVPAVKVGALSGITGLIYGGFSGILRSKHPAVHSFSLGVHWFAIGTSYWWLRSNILRTQFGDNANPNQRTYVSALAGGLAGGGVSWAFNRRFVPGLVAFSVLGCLGQLSFNAVDEWHAQQQGKPAKPWPERLTESPWVPIRTLSNEQYKEMLTEKLLGVEAEIALIDERIQTLRDEAERSSSTE